MKNSKNAFSLIEALIILMLISIAIMGLIPLLSKKVNAPKWMQSRVNPDSSITFGTSVANRIGIGQDADPYDNPEARMTIKSLLLGTTPGSSNANSSISLGYRFDDATGNYTPYSPDESVVLGMNIANAIPANSLIIKSSDVADGIDVGGIDIGNKIILKSGTFKLYGIDKTREEELVDDPHPFIELKNNGDFIIRFPHSSSAETPDEAIAMEYTASTPSTLTIPKAMLNIGADGSGTLTLDWYGSGNRSDGVDRIDISPDSITCEDSLGDYVVLNSFTQAWEDLQDDLYVTCSYEHAENDSIQKFDKSSFPLSEYGTCIVDAADGEFFRSTQALKSVSYCYGTGVQGKNWWNYSSDKRLKNILSDFNKGMNDLENLETYNFTYKSDAKQRNHVGLIAQKLKGVYDEALHQDEKGYLSYEKEPIMYSMVNAVKEIFKTQNDFDKKQTKLNKKADKLIRMYE